MIDLVTTSSPGAIASQLLARAGVRQPHLTFALKEAEHDRWTESFYGGWCEVDTRMTGLISSVASLDISSCFPLVAHLLGWWLLLCAERIRRVGVATALRRLCARAIVDPLVVMDPMVWGHFGCTLVEVIPHGELWPVELEDERRPDGRLEVTELCSTNRPFSYPWPDVVSAAIRSKRVPTIVSAVSFQPVGSQAGLRPSLRLRPNLRLDLSEDPAIALVRHRAKCKERGDHVLADQLRTVTNALVYGNFCRFDPVRVKVAGKWANRERPGPWNCMPIASTVTSGSRLLLGLFDRMVRDRGSLVLYRDTDSSILPASECGAEIALPDGGTLRSLAWSEIEEISAAFEPLSPSPDWPVWHVKKGAA